MKIGPRPDQQPVAGATGTGTSAGGDVGGTLPGGTVVTGIGGIPIEAGSPADGDVLVYDSTSGEWQYVPASGFTDPMTTRGDIIYRNASNVTARLPVGGAAEVLTSDGTDISWEAPTGGGGGSRTALGYTTIGGSSKNMAASTWYHKKIAVPSAGWIMSIVAYMGESTDNVFGWSTGVWSDNGGDVDAPLIIAGGAFNTYAPHDSASATTAWIAQPCGLWIPAAGDYWLGIMAQSSTGGTLTLFYDGSGSDRSIGSTGAWALDQTGRTQTDTTHTHSLYANFMS